MPDLKNNATHVNTCCFIVPEKETAEIEQDAREVSERIAAASGIQQAVVGL